MTKLLLTTAFTLITSIIFGQATLVNEYLFDGNSSDNTSSANHLQKVLTATNTNTNGIIFNDITYVAGVTGLAGDSAAQFPGNIGFRSLNNITNNTGTNGISISYWIKSPNYGYIIQGPYAGFGSRSSYMQGSESGVQVKSFFDGSSATAVSSDELLGINPTWNHIAVQNNGTTSSTYVNGVLKNTLSEVKYGMVSADFPLAYYFVGQSYTDAEYYVGVIDNLKIYHGTLTQTQITTLYSEGIVNSIQSNASNQTPSIFINPNPTSSILNIKVKEQTKISIVNILGEVIKTETINGTSQLDISNLNTGVYFIQEATSGKAIKFIKE